MANNVQQKEEKLIINKRPISIKKAFVDKDIVELIYLLWEVSPATLQKDFKAVGVEINNNADIDALINLYTSGNDKKGVLVNQQGRILMFDTRKIIMNMNIPTIDLNVKGSNVKWVK